jgi:hypothetical protein
MNATKRVAAHIAANADVTLHRVTHDYALASFDRVFMVVWRHRTTVDGARDTARAAARFRAQRGSVPPPSSRRSPERSSAARAPERFASFILVVATDGAPPPDDAARETLAQMFAAGTGEILAAAIVPQGSEMQASFVRGVATGLNLQAKLTYPLRACGAGEAFQLFAQTATAAGVDFDAERALDLYTRILVQIDSEGPVSARVPRY